MADLGRDESKHIKCEYVGREDSCPKDCDRCAISIKTAGDIAIGKGDLDDAVRNYKKALFLEPKFAEAWTNLGNALGMRSNYDEAIQAFDKAIEIDSKYGKALYGKAITLSKQNKKDSAIEVAEKILTMYSSKEVEDFIMSLQGGTETNGSEIQVSNKTFSPNAASNVSNKDMLSLVNNLYEQLVDIHELKGDNGELPFIDEIFQPKQFTISFYNYCKRKYTSLGEKKLNSEYIITAYYASICAVMYYKKDREGIIYTQIFDYLNSHIDVEFTDVNAEKLLGIRDNQEMMDKIWNICVPLLRAAVSAFEAADELSQSLVTGAMEYAYRLGMLVGVKYGINTEKHGAAILDKTELDRALRELAASSTSYKNPPPESAMCYSPRMPRETELYFKCERCGSNVHMTVNEEGGEEKNIIIKYKALAGEFRKLGHYAGVHALCENCSKIYHTPRYSWDIEHIVFEFKAKGSNETVYSFPNNRSYSDFNYKMALTFLQGERTVEGLSKATDSQLDAEDYIKSVNEIVGKSGL